MRLTFPNSHTSAGAAAPGSRAAKFICAGGRLELRADGCGRRSSASRASGKPRAASSNRRRSSQSLRSDRSVRTGSGHRGARDLHLGAGGEARIFVNFSQREHRKPDGPQAEAADSGSCRELIMCNPGHCADAHAPRRPVRACRHRSADRGSRRQPRQIDAVGGKNLLRQPTRSAAAVLPDILENIRHLQTLRERNGQALQFCAIPGDSAAEYSQNSSVSISPTTPAT